MEHRKWIGHTYPRFSSKVYADQIRFFAKAIGEKNPIYTDQAIAQKAGYRDVLAPPTYAFTLSLNINDVFDYIQDMGFALDNLLHGEQGFEYYHPIIAGDVIHFDRTIDDIYEKKQGALTFINESVVLTNQDGQNVGKMTCTTVYLKQTSPAKSSSAKAEIDVPLPTIIKPTELYQKLPNLEEVNIGDALPTLVKPPITRTNLALFAGASNDHNPIHIDIDFARNAGYDDVFAHGMLVMAYMGQALTNWLPLWHWESFSARFKAITQVGNTLSFKGEVVKKNDDSITLALAVVDEYGEEKLVGKAVLKR